MPLSVRYRNDFQLQMAVLLVISIFDYLHVLAVVAVSVEGRGVAAAAAGVVTNVVVRIYGNL